MIIPGLSVLKRHVHWILLDVLVTFVKVVTKHLRSNCLGQERFISARGLRGNLPQWRGADGSWRLTPTSGCWCGLARSFSSFHPVQNPNRWELSPCAGWVSLPPLKLSGNALTDPPRDQSLLIAPEPSPVQPG